MKNKLIALCGKSASGKDTILKRVVSIAPNEFHEIVSCTTRDKREGEEEGVNYHYYSKKQFQEAIKTGQMLEYTEFNGWLYGTPRNSLSLDKINIGVFNPSGIKILRLNYDIQLYIVYIAAEDKNRLMRQLTRESKPDVKEIIRRYEADEKDFVNFYHEFSDVVTFSNDTDLSKDLIARAIVNGQYKTNYLV